MQHYMIKVVSDLRQVGGLLRFPIINKTDRHDITEILLKVALNTININQTTSYNVLISFHMFVLDVYSPQQSI